MRYNKFFIFALMLAVALSFACGGGSEKEQQADEGYSVPGMDIQVKHYPPIRVAYEEYMGPYEESGDEWEAFAMWAMQNVPQAATSMFIGIYYDDPEMTPPESCRAEMAVVVPEDYAGDKEHLVKEIPEMTAASVRLVGPFEEIVEQYDEIYGWVVQHNYRPVGPMYEHMIKFGPEIPDSEYVTEIRIPVEEIGGEEGGHAEGSGH